MPSLAGVAACGLFRRLGGFGRLFDADETQVERGAGFTPDADRLVDDARPCPLAKDCDQIERLVVGITPGCTLPGRADDDVG